MQQMTISLPQEHNIRKTSMNSCDNISPVEGKTKPHLNADRVLSNELLETLRRECLERKVMARLSRGPITIDTKKMSTEQDGDHRSTYVQVKQEPPNCNYVLSENYENLSGDESQAARSFDTNEVDHKAIAPFLPLLDAMEKHGNEQEKRLAEEAEDDFPEEGSLVIDDGETASKAPARRWNRRPSVSRRKSPEMDSPMAAVVEKRETPSPALRRPSKEIVGDLEESTRKDATVAAKEVIKERKPLLLKDSKSKRLSLGSSKRSSSGIERRPDGNSECTGGPAGTTGRRGRRKSSRHLVKSGSDESADKRIAPAGGCDPSDDSTVRNGQRKRGRWKSGTADSDKASEEGSDSNNTVDYQLSSDDDAGKQNRTVGPEDVASGRSGTKRQRKNAEEAARKSAGNEPQNDESRYKRLAQELPGFNWLEQKIMGHGSNYTEPSPAAKPAAPRTPTSVVEREITGCPTVLNGIAEDGADWDGRQ